MHVGGQGKKTLWDLQGLKYTSHALFLRKDSEVLWIKKNQIRKKDTQVNFRLRTKMGTKMGRNNFFKIGRLRKKYKKVKK